MVPTLISCPTTDAPVRPTSRIGTTIGRYRVQRVVGAGGMGIVYEAFDEDLDRAVALKVMRYIGDPDDTLAERLVRESKLMAKVVHPSVITVFDAGRSAGDVYIAMELIRGTTLARHFGGKLHPWRDVLAVYEKAGRGLAAAHGANIVHRDFKPDNVLVEYDRDRVCRVLVTDFGVAQSDPYLPPGAPAGPPVRPSKVALAITEPVLPGPPLSSPAARAARAQSLTETGQLVGTVAYMAPEQLAGGRVDARADIFAFAVSLWESLFGERPFRGSTIGEIVDAMKAPPVPPAGVRVPASIVRILQRALAIQPHGRPPTIVRLLDDLAAAAARPRKLLTASAAAALLGVGLVASRLLAAAPVDPCARELGAFDRALPAGAHVLRARAAAWRNVQAETCRVDRPPAVSACLDARKTELVGIAQDIVDAPSAAAALATFAGDPRDCAYPTPASAVAHVPAERELRRAVNAQRAALRAAETHADAQAAHEIADAAAWPPVRAEALLLAGTLEAKRRDKQASTTLQDAAASAQRSGDDELVARCRVALVDANLAIAQSEPDRILEYIRDADGAVGRIGRPADLEVQLDSMHAQVLVSLDRLDEAETFATRALAIARATVPARRHQAELSLAMVDEYRGRYADAVAHYREAIAQLPQGASDIEIDYRQRLASVLILVDRLDEAEAEARHAVALADQMLQPSDVARPYAHSVVASVLQAKGDLPAALAEIQLCTGAIANSAGKRSSEYGDNLRIEADILEGLGRLAEADADLRTACEIIAFRSGEQSALEAECLMTHASVLAERDKEEEARALTAQALAIFSATYGEDHVQTTNAHQALGLREAAVGHHDQAIAHLERAVAGFARATVDSGYLGSAEWQLAEELSDRDPTRARTLLEDAVAKLHTASPQWADILPKVEAALRRTSRIARRG